MPSTLKAAPSFAPMIASLATAPSVGWDALVSTALLATALLGSSPAIAGAWTQEKRHGYYKLEGRALVADELYTPVGTRIDIPTLGDYTTSLYGEYGLGRRVTLLGYAPFKRLTLDELESSQTGQTISAGDSETGVGDWDLGVRIGLVQNRPFVLSLGVTLGLPLGNEDQQSGLLTGDGEFNQLVSVQAGVGFRRTPLYLSGLIGLNNRTGGYSDEFHYAGEIGFRFSRAFSAALRARGVESRQNGDDAFSGGGSGLFANNQEYLVYGPELTWHFNDSFGISAAYEAITRGRNVLSAPAYSLGLFLKK